MREKSQGPIKAIGLGIGLIGAFLFVKGFSAATEGSGGGGNDFLIWGVILITVGVGIGGGA